MSKLRCGYHHLCGLPTAPVLPGRQASSSSHRSREETSDPGVCCITYGILVDNGEEDLSRCTDAGGERASEEMRSEEAKRRSREGGMGVGKVQCMQVSNTHWYFLV